MKIGVLTQEKYLNNGLQTFESNIAPYLLEDERFEPIFYEVHNGYPFSRTIQTALLKKKIQETNGKFDKIFIPAQNRLTFDPNDLDAEIIPYVHDIIPYCSAYKTERNRMLRPFIDALVNKFSIEYLPHLSKLETAICASNFSKSDLNLRTSFSGSAETIYQGVDDMPSPENFDVENERKIDLLFVGELFDRKNPEFVEKCLQKAVNQGFNVATVNFDGHDLPGKNMEGLTDEELAEVYSDSRYLLHASLLEGFGRCPVEAQRYGCIPLALDNRVNREILGNPSLGYWSVIKSVDDVLKDLERTVSNDMRKAPMENSERFKWESCRKKIKEVLLQ